MSNKTASFLAGLACPRKKRAWTSVGMKEVAILAIWEASWRSLPSQSGFPTTILFSINQYNAPFLLIRAFLSHKTVFHGFALLRGRYDWPEEYQRLQVNRSGNRLVSW